MTIGGSLLLIAVGAILKWAVTATVSFIDLRTVGTIVFIVGLAGLAVSLLYTFYTAPRGGRPEEPPTRQMPPSQPPRL
jgi:hypothetical protein